MSAPALATMVNAVPIPGPEPVGLEARNPGLGSAAMKAVDFLDKGAKVANSATDAVNAGNSLFTAGDQMFNNIMDSTQ